MDQPIRLYTIKEVAEQLRVSERTVLHLMAKGELRAIKIGLRNGKRLFRHEDLQAFVDRAASVAS